MKKKKLVNKVAKKRLEGKCTFCDIADYSLLEVHRIVFGENGGKYHPHNSLTVCRNCHARIHSGELRIDKKYQGITGEYFLHYWEKDKEEWKKLTFD